MNPRVIPSLLLKDNGLVKTLKFRQPKYIGDPINAIRIFNEKEVDELLVLDIDASKIKKEPNYKLIEEFASECFMPLAYGGGVSRCEQAAKIFKLGVEKIVIQSAAITDPSIITELSSEFGSQSIVVSIDLKMNIFGKLFLYDAKRKKSISKKWIEFASMAQNAGAGEVLLNVVDKDGTLSGPNLEPVKMISSHLSIPVIGQGGVSSCEDIKSLFSVGASAVAIGAFCVFSGPHRAVLITYPTRDQIESITSNK